MFINVVIVVELKNDEDLAAFEENWRKQMDLDPLPTEWETSEGFPESRFIDTRIEVVK